MKYLSFTLFILLFSVKLIAAQETVSKEAKAQNILSQAKTINKDFKFETVTSLNLNYVINSTSTTGNERYDSTESNKLYLIPNKIREDIYDEYGSNSSKISLILNGDSFERKFEYFVNGKKQKAQFNFSTPKEMQIKSLKKKSWIAVFPIFLDSFIYQNVSFTYTGRGDLNGKLTGIIEAIVDDSKFQFFFDESDYHLLLIIENGKDKTGQSFQTKYFFSDYKKDSGLLFAHKINFQSTLDSVGTGETIIKNLILNTALNPNLFDVKK